MKKTFFNFMVIALVMFLVASCSSKSANNTADNTAPPKGNDSSVVGEQENGTNSGSISSGKYDPPLKLDFAVGRVDSDVNFPDGQTTKDNKWTRLVEEELGIKLNVTLAMAASSEYTQKLNSLIITNELPDLFTVHHTEYNQLDQIIRAGLAEDITDVFYEHASPLVRELLPEEALEPLKRDGKLYFIPQLLNPAEEGNIMWIRTDWLKKLNIQEPKTFQDIIAIAEAFKALDPAKNYGFQAGLESWDMYSLSGFFAAYHAYPDAWIKDSNGNLVNGTIQPETKAALKSLQEMKSKGLINKEWTINDDGAKAREDLVTGKVGISFGKWWAPEWPLFMTKDNDQEAEWDAFAFVSIDDKPALHLKNVVSASSFYVLKKGYSNPEALIKMLNLQAEHYWGDNPTVDPEGSSLWKIAPVVSEPWGKNIQFQAAIEAALASGDTSKLHPAAVQIYEMIKNEGEDSWGVGKEYGVNGSLGLYAKLTKNNLWINNEFFGTPTETMATKQANLDKLFQETFISIVEGADINTFDTFVEQWKSQGGDDITKEVNDWYRSK
ncbi:putative aldouronate transport system substrate-binding protein [Paenibacillus castaneae]|uniref:extracellular solute-binding protein n=1 Tax=Paenibacillus castaneae TaxID=474957 RepID=UPI00141B7AB7|nr:extracellular solute-binding protein [Paenibacillus castaneae]NIK78688.1 putative aldouronate transport system substrate-binding protein [Paenibacillus castaneae]